MQSNARLASAVLLVAGALVLGGCAVPEQVAAEQGTDDRITVVAGTDVYGSIAEAIGGDLIEVTSIVSGSAQDPHEYEATARDHLAVSEADLVIVNGGGYDDFMVRLLEGSSAVVINASEVSGLMPEEAPQDDHQEAPTEEADAAGHEGHAHTTGFNEHVWYSIHAVEHIAEAITADLIELDPASAEVFEANSGAFLTALGALHDRAHALEEELGGGDVISTELVAAYLLADLGLHDVTPLGFATATESGTGISARLLDEVLHSFADEDIRLLAVNPQSAGPEAQLVREAAAAAGVPVVEFSETLPEGTDYLGWLAANLDALEAALR